MADEENKNSIVVAPEDESTCDKEEAEQETELSSILDKLSLEPKKEKQKKKLLVLSLSGLLLHRVHRRTNRKTPKNRSPDASCGPNLVYKRPFAEEFMKFILERFEVGIWSSACETKKSVLTVEVRHYITVINLCFSRISLKCLSTSKASLLQTLSSSMMNHTKLFLILTIQVCSQ
ncbi:unnamed protein product [Brassica napus]|uniref:Mitochondrial import inner membrane translocase subunit TIM50 n=1 Tax=Brassica napus TaxID=3708 RepID=A0A816JHP3_BRANA|nr:unnamed protein product [Brassica napus]